MREGEGKSHDRGSRGKGQARTPGVGGGLKSIRRFLGSLRNLRAFGQQKDRGKDRRAVWAEVGPQKCQQGDALSEHHDSRKSLILQAEAALPTCLWAQRIMRGPSSYPSSQTCSVEGPRDSIQLLHLRLASVGFSACLHPALHHTQSCMREQYYQWLVPSSHLGSHTLSPAH